MTQRKVTVGQLDSPRGTSSAGLEDWLDVATEWALKVGELNDRHLGVGRSSNARRVVGEVHGRGPHQKRHARFLAQAGHVVEPRTLNLGVLQRLAHLRFQVLESTAGFVLLRQVEGLDFTVRRLQPRRFDILFQQRVDRDPTSLGFSLETSD